MNVPGSLDCHDLQDYMDILNQVFLYLESNSLIWQVAKNYARCSLLFHLLFFRVAAKLLANDVTLRTFVREFTQLLGPGEGRGGRVVIHHRYIHFAVSHHHV